MRSVEAAVQQRWHHEDRVASTVSSTVVLLYIQMQLCSQTLRQWLNERNLKLKSSSPSLMGNNIDLELSIFRQIVKGINYIHNSNIIHRDIKVISFINLKKFKNRTQPNIGLLHDILYQPENIFIDKATNKVQIGDFGLAKLGLNSETEMTRLTVATPGFIIHFIKSLI